MELGLLPALGGGIAELRRTGQASRLVDGYLAPYARAFDRISYFSYLPERLEDYTGDPALAASVALLAPRGLQPRIWRTLAMPLVHRSAFARCAVFRVFQVTGAIPALLARARWGTPFVTSYGFWYGRLSRPGPSRVAKRLLERIALGRAAAVIVPTADLASHVATVADPAHVHFIPNGVDVGRFRPGARRDGPRGRIVYVGRLSKEKNLAALVQAAALLRRRLPVRLVLVGAGPERAALEGQARAAGVPVEFPGVIDHAALPAWLTGADAFALPSFTEGHPKALIEAMATGLPCVASDCGGNRSVLKDGDTGLLFDPHDPSALAERLERVLVDAGLADALGARAREVAARDYDLSHLVEAEIDLLKRVARDGR